MIFYFIFLFNIKDPKVTNMSHNKEPVLNTKEPVKYTNKLIKKTTNTG